MPRSSCFYSLACALTFAMTGARQRERRQPRWHSVRVDRVVTRHELVSDCWRQEAEHGKRYPFSFMKRSSSS